jgi:hypothetical protein
MYALAFSTSSNVVSRTMVSLIYAHGLLGGEPLEWFSVVDGGRSPFSNELLELPSAGGNDVGSAVYAI